MYDDILRYDEEAEGWQLVGRMTVVRAGHAVTTLAEEETRQLAKLCK